MPAEPMLQSSLGIAASNSSTRDRTWNNGYLFLGRVLKVHHKRYTADVQLLGSSDVILSSNAQEGKHSCRIGVGNAGFDETFGKPYGEIIPIQEGSLVLVAFLENKRERPVILRVFHDITEANGQNNAKNVLDVNFLNTTKLSEIDTRRYTNISRIQDFITIDGLGNFEFSSHTKAFFVGKYTQEVDPENYGYEELSIKDNNENTINVPESESKPMKFIAAAQDSYNSETCNWIRLFVDAAKTIFKVAKQQRKENKLSTIEIAENGEIRLLRQQDDCKFDSGVQHTSLGISETGEITIDKVNGDKKTTITIDENGDVNISKEGTKKTSILITDEGMMIDSESKVSITAKDTIDVTSEKEINLGEKVNIKELQVGTTSIDSQGNIKTNGDISTSGNVTASSQVKAGSVNADCVFDQSLSVGGAGMDGSIGGVPLDEFLASSDYEPGSWLYCVEAVKAMLAAQGLEYSQSAVLTYDFGSFKTTVHPDCSGTVTAMVSMYTGKSMSQISSSGFTSASSLPGFTKQSWNGWDNLQTGDIISRNGHVEVYAYSEGGKHYVWNAGSTSSVQSATPTVSGHDSYTTVWRVNE